MTFWENKLIEDLNTIIKVNVIKLGKIIHTLNEESRKQWIDSLKEEINESCTLLIEEATFFVAVQYLRKNCFKLCELLQIDMVSYEAEQLTFYEEKKILEERLREYEEIILYRQHKFKEMTAKQIKLCRLLEKIPLTFTEKSVPTEEELNNLSLHIQNLEDEKIEIEEKFENIKLKIRIILQELNLKISPEVEKIVNSSPVLINKEDLQYLYNYYNELRQEENRKEYKELKSLEKVINDLYNTCHIQENKRTIIQNIHQYKLDVIQEEINKLRNYWKSNESMFILLEKYNQHWSTLVVLIENQQIDFNHKHEQVIKLCRLIRKFESELIEGAMKFEENEKEAFTTYGKTIPELIAELHDTHGKHTISINDTRKTLSAIINGIKKKQQYLTADKVISSQYLNIEGSYSQNKREIKTRQPLKQSRKNFKNINKVKSTEINEKREDNTNPQILSEIQKSSSEYQPVHKSNIFSGNSDCKEQHINMHMSEEKFVNANTVMATTIANKNLQSMKLKNNSVCKKRKIPSYGGIQTTRGLKSTSNEGIFKPKAVEMIQNLLQGLELK